MSFRPWANATSAGVVGLFVGQPFIPVCLFKLQVSLSA
jgi:hypothetical protein